MYRVCLMRHGEAGFDALRDELRNLTERGREDTRCIVQTRLPEPEGLEIYASPYRRTQQTAELITDIWGGAGVHSSELLVPDSDPQAVVDWLATLPGSQLLLVTHQPLIGRLLGLLVDGDARRAHPMGTSSLSCLTGEVLAAGCLSQEWVAHCR